MKKGISQRERVVIILLIGDHIEIEDPLKEVDTTVKMGGHQIEEDTRIEDTLGEGTPTKMEDHLEGEVHLKASRPPWTSKSGNSADPPSNLGYICIGEYL